MKKNSIFSNSLFFAIYKLLNILFPLITSTYVARVLLPTGTGKVALAQNIVTYFTLIAALGLPTYGTREIAKSIKEKKEYNKVFWELFFINFVSTSICVISYYSLIFILPNLKAERNLYFVAGLSIVLNYFNIDWLYQGREEYKYISIRGILIKALSVILLFLFVKTKNDYVIYAGIYAFILGGNNLINLIGLKKRINKPSFSNNFKRHFKPIFILFFTNLSIELYTLLDTTMLGYFCNEKIVGLYTYAMKTSKVIIVLLTSVTTVFLPRLSNYYSEGNFNKYKSLIKTGIEFLIFVSIPISILLFINADNVILFLYGKEYIEANLSLMILSILIIPISMSTFLGNQVLCSSNNEKYMLISVSSGALVNMILNSILIRQFEHNGAAIASVVSESIVMIMEVFFIHKILKIKLDKKIIYTTFLSCFGMVFITINLKRIINNIFISLLISTSCGILVYIIIFYILYPKYVLDMLEKIFGKKLKILNRGQ